MCNFRKKILKESLKKTQVGSLNGTYVEIPEITPGENSEGEILKWRNLGRNSLNIASRKSLRNLRGTSNEILEETSRRISEEIPARI